MKKYIYQIYYDEETHKKLLSGFIPLDNTKSLRPDWFEFWPILNYLRNNILEEDAWYGFLSPRFEEKTGFSSHFVLNVIENHGNVGNVALFSTFWDLLAYYLNPFVQGEDFHPGLMEASENFINKFGLGVNLRTLVSDSATSVFSNYIVAKKEFWLKWKKIAEQFFEYAENHPEYQTKTRHRAVDGHYPMKIFIQERLATLLLTTETFKVITPDQSLVSPIFTGFFPGDNRTRRLLQACDLMKGKYRESSDEKYLDMFYKLRKDIQYSNPNNK